MNYIEFTKNLEKLRIGIFTANDARRILGKPQNYVNLFLYRLSKKGLIIRISKSRYALGGASKLELAYALAGNGYISTLSALFYYNLINQDPNSVDIVNTIASKKRVLNSEFGSMQVRLVKLKPERLFGYRRVLGNVSYFLIAEPEKAIIDTLYIYKSIYAGLCNEAVKRGINTALLKAYAERMKSKKLVELVEGVLNA
jgi:predicted transcriptional regulator of viral defense system